MRLHLLLLAALASAALPPLPLTTSGRWIHDAAGKRVTYAGTNWPGHQEAMLPEGLAHQSAASIAGHITSLGMNVVRLTYATQMVDEHVARGSDVPAKEGLIKALGRENGTRVWGEIRKRNAGLREQAGRLEVFDLVARELGKAGVVVHLDNHISRATWCCSTKDGNSWFGDTDFDAAKWKRGWSFMANYTRSWTALGSVGLRNELRAPDNNPQLKERSYKWGDWYTHMRAAAGEVHAANPSLIVFLSGFGFDTDLTAVVRDTKVLKKSDFLPNKIALELHNYQNNEKNCGNIRGGLYNHGWNALNESDKGVANVLPVVMSEFGFAQDMKTAGSVYATCLRDYLVQNKAGWMVWVLSGSYYIRSGKQEFDEAWGLLKKDWSGWRSEEVVEKYFRPFVRASLKG
ncbi:glycoside hydrolase family 5 protein [Trichodelitschia bisporula]|uniref:Glycoside hydrolase family 5 protein n=1 Tax=Trichodelitschia bisporula TaxID=703511 RepID=A0A6G1HIN4_9PEZI|nr:glycoside hydrolase family 5 protein [Trichodelitschia bisporula]